MIYCLPSGGNRKPPHGLRAKHTKRRCRCKRTVSRKYGKFRTVKPAGSLGKGVDM